MQTCVQIGMQTCVQTRVQTYVCAGMCVDMRADTQVKTRCVSGDKSVSVWMCLHICCICMYVYRSAWKCLRTCVQMDQLFRMYVLAMHKNIKLLSIDNCIDMCIDM